MLLAGFLSGAVMKDYELSPPLEVAERIHTNHFLSVLDQQLVETQREREREGEREKEKERERFATQHYRGWKTQSWMASRMQKMISHQPPIRPTPDKPWAPPLVDATKLLKQLDKAKVAIPSKAHSLSGFPCCKGWSPSGNPSEPFQRNLKHLRRLRVKYYLNIWTNPQGQSQVRPSFCLEHLTSPK